MAVFVEQPLASPRSANYINLFLRDKNYDCKGEGINKHTDKQLIYQARGYFNKLLFVCIWMTRHIGSKVAFENKRIIVQYHSHPLVSRHLY